MQQRAGTGRIEGGQALPRNAATTPVSRSPMPPPPCRIAGADHPHGLPGRGDQTAGPFSTTAQR
jgi:hypothetical protein